jgi:hypothetical protein
MKTTEYKELQLLTLGEIEILEQAYQRLNAEGILHGWDLGEFLDVVLARGSWSDTSTDELALEQEDDTCVTPPQAWMIEAWSKEAFSDDFEIQARLDQDQMTEWDHEK